RYVDRIEQPGVLGWCDAGIDRLDQQPGAGEIKPEAVLAGETGDPPPLGQIEGLTGHAADRRLDRDRADWYGDAGLGRSGDRRRCFVEREARATGGGRGPGDTPPLL